MKRTHKPKLCAFSKCRRQFTPRNGLQRTCPTPKCALGYVAEKRAKKERREAARWTRVQREAMKSRRELLAEAQKAVTRFVEQRTR